MTTIGGEPPLLPETPPFPPNGGPISRGIVDGFLLALGYDPAWVIAVHISPGGVRVDTVQGELAPIIHSVFHTWATPEPIPEPRR